TRRSQRLEPMTGRVGHIEGNMRFKALLESISARGIIRDSWVVICRTRMIRLATPVPWHRVRKGVRKRLELNCQSWRRLAPLGARLVACMAENGPLIGALNSGLLPNQRQTRDQVCLGLCVAEPNDALRTLYELWWTYDQAPVFLHTGERAQVEFAVYRCQHEHYDETIHALEDQLRPDASISPIARAGERS